MKLAEFLQREGATLRDSDLANIAALLASRKRVLVRVLLCHDNDVISVQELQEQYAYKEKTVEQAAARVGLSLPKKVLRNRCIPCILLC